MEPLRGVSTAAASLPVLLETAGVGELGAGQGAPLGQEWLLEEMPCVGAVARLWGWGSALLSRLRGLGSILPGVCSSQPPVLSSSRHLLG